LSVLRRTERPAHRAPTRHRQAAYPFMAEDGLGGRGVHIGTDANGGAFVYDPWELYGVALTNPNMLVGGQIGKGKSSFVKTYIYRQAVFPRLAWILDPKGEYGPLAHALGCEPIRLEPNGSVRLNPLIPRAGWNEQVRLLKAVAAAELRRPLSPAESGALREALRIVQADTSEPTVPEIAALLLRPTSELSDPLATDAATLAQHVRDVALALQDLCEGELAACSTAPPRPAWTSTPAASYSMKRAADGRMLLPTRVTPHTLRRTFASLCFFAGRDLRWVMGQVGHDDPRMTLGVYAQCMKRSQIDETLVWELMRFPDEAETGAPEARFGPTNGPTRPSRRARRA
jgi:hypothetical protein